MVNAAIIGATGYGGVELMRLLQGHPQVRLAYLSSETYAGQRVRDVCPQLAGVEGRLRALDPAAVAVECDYALVSVPAGKSLEVTPTLLGAGVRVIDVSPDFRLTDPALYPVWYKFEHTHPELLKEAVCGLPEWYRESLQKARLVAAPGCYSTAAVLALAPLAEEKLIELTDIVADGKSGLSGAGRTSLRLEYHYPEANEDVSAYSVGGHRHLPEMVQVLEEIGGARASLCFTPHLAPMTRGILMTCYVKPRPGIGLGRLREALVRRYQGEPFVQVLPEGSWPHTKWTAGTNHCFIGLGEDRASGRAVVVSAIDNLGKGMSGQMVQCLNLMLGVGETTGLSMPAAYP
jgi:N-acetyl-gamma-glutamyl-phosphate reductase